MDVKYYDKLFSKLLEHFPNPGTELRYETPFQLLVAVMLSAQTTDKQVNKVSDKFFKKVKKPEDVVFMSEEEVEKALSSINYYKMKSKHIVETSKMIVEKSKKVKDGNLLSKKEKEVFLEYGYLIPESIDELVKFPGVGEKTAKVVLYVLYDYPLIAVDTHVHRVINRLGILTTETPLETSKKIELEIPNKRKKVAHHLIILFGRYHCKSKNPKCESCPVCDLCAFYKSNSLDSSQ